MKLFGQYEIRRVVGAEGKTPNVQLLTDAELRLAFAVADTEPWWRAVLQVLEAMKEEAARQAEASVMHHGVCASFVGHGEFARLLRKRLLRLREEGLRGRRAGNGDR